MSNPNLTKPLLFFMHIPKTGGVTLKGILEKQYRKQVYFPLMPIHLLEYDQKQMKNHTCFRGHYPYWLMRNLLWDRPFCFTLLREPVDRCLSFYAHVLSVGDKKFPGSPPVMSLRDFFYSGPFVARMSNLQTRYLTMPFVGKTFSELNNEIGQEILAIKTGEIKPSADKAIEALKTNVDLYGLTEKYDDFIQKLGERLGWQKRPLYQPQNVSKPHFRPRREDVEQDIIERIIEINQEDIKLYEYAKNTIGG